jgi:hypothetical protein
LGSGVLNLLSVINPSLLVRRLLLREFFPLEFLAVSRFLTLLIGFALAIVFDVASYGCQGWRWGPKAGSRHAQVRRPSMPGCSPT